MKNQFMVFEIEIIRLDEQLFIITFIANSEFKNTLFSKSRPNFCRPSAISDFLQAYVIIHFGDKI